MVSTRQSSNVGGGGENTTIHEPGPSRSHRQSIPGPSAQDGNNTILFNGTGKPLGLTDLPPEILEKILIPLGFKNIGLLRLVNHKMDGICSQILNSTFQKLQAQMMQRFQNIKAKMPRRESARRNHPLACESDIIETLHMRLTLLQMTFGKHIERKHCCFFAGEILDEVHRILSYIQANQVLDRPYKVTDELFDLSTMAMEYFKEHIEPTLPEIAYFSSDFLEFTGTFSAANNKYLCLESPSDSNSKRNSIHQPILDEIGDDAPPQSNMVLRKRIRKIKQGMKRYNNQLTNMRRDLRSCKSKIAEQQKQILDYAARLDENDKKNEETSRKFSTLLQELNKCKTELQYWRSKSRTNQSVCEACGGALAPLPNEDLQALANQGLFPEGGAGLVEIPPAAGSSNDNNEALWESTLKKDAEDLPLSFSGDEQKQTGKRKGCDEEPSSPIMRRVHKSRSKRAKV